LEKDEKHLIGRRDLLDKGCILSDKVYIDKAKILLTGGNISFSSARNSFYLKSKASPMNLFISPLSIQDNIGEQWRNPL
jgi:hypothetical protein